MGFLLLHELSLLNRFAFATTRFRYRWTIFSPEAPAIKLSRFSSVSVPKYEAASPTVSITSPLLRVSGNASGETMVNPDNEISFITTSG